ncbi:MAG: RDD family protein [Streptosporangiaceae bacterium]
MPYCSACGGFHADDAAYCPFCGGPVGSTAPALVYSGFWRRVGGLVIDALVIGIPFEIFISVVGGSGLSSTTTTNPVSGNQTIHFHFHPARFFGLLLLQMTVAGAYSVLLQASANQGTLGQMAVGVRVTDLAGERISHRRAVIRYLGYLLSSILFGLGNLVMLVTEKNQALQDLLADTLVVKARK